MTMIIFINNVYDDEKKDKRRIINYIFACDKTKNPTMKRYIGRFAKDEIERVEKSILEDSERRKAREILSKIAALIG